MIIQIIFTLIFWLQLCLQWRPEEYPGSGDLPTGAWTPRTPPRGHRWPATVANQLDCSVHLLRLVYKMSNLGHGSILRVLHLFVTGTVSTVIKNDLTPFFGITFSPLMQKWETISFFNADPNPNLLVGSRSALITHSHPDLDGNCHSHKIGAWRLGFISSS